jgi:hypothetical protein
VMFPLFLAQIHFVILNHSHELVSIYIYISYFMVDLVLMYFARMNYSIFL